MPCLVVLGWVFWFLIVDGLFLLSKLYTLVSFPVSIFSWSVCALI